ncbi:hypothetical protein [Oceanobacillus profundus]|uniref:Uncharacterized protein n=1 Tax=Oceanobacillus profundus TaxID=372463 RepID=A0A417YEJ4_9BACI|nr:hypothetical protein [Oceanobacillus profundus]MCM3398948.1 hypothetical protein [Oceanobacillus profundus]PAE28455.1 hypothetical protein CHI07_14180 [Paenibacillus sp. 7884-2]RHW31078.1 hypothetical protein D1B32_15015 [Oceanobacillus profundus]
MNRYVKLVNFELGRFMKVYIALIGITIISQLAAVIVVSKSYLNNANQAMNVDHMAIETFIEQYGRMSFNDVTNSIFFIGPIALCIVTLLIYSLFIWYRDWFGKNTFIYRLLMLPTARLNVYLAKASAIFLFVLGLVGLQILLLPLERMILQWMVPIDLRWDLSINEMIRNFDRLGIMLPYSIAEFAIHYGIGFMAVIVLFTIIMFERCYRLKGILLGIGYGALALIVFFLPVFVQEFMLYNYFYPEELFMLMLVTGLLVTAGSIWMSNHLLTRKIRV